MYSANGYVMRINTKLIAKMIPMACAGKVFICSSLFAPKYCEISAEIALLVCPKTQTNMEINAPAIPTALNASVALRFTFPTTAVSVIDSNGSAIPAINAGIASLLMCESVICVFKVRVRNSKRIYTLLGKVYVS